MEEKQDYVMTARYYLKKWNKKKVERKEDGMRENWKNYREKIYIKISMRSSNCLVSPF